VGGAGHAGAPAPDRDARAHAPLVGILRAYRQAATAMPDGALVLDRRDGRLVWFNKSARRLLGLQYPQSLDRRCRDCGRRRGWREWLRRARRGSDARTALAARRVACCSACACCKYSPEQWLLVVRDVTQLARLEQVRRDFVANVSHELRTPLTVVHGYLDMMEPEDNPEWAPMVREMRQQSQRMGDLLEDLLTLSRLESRDSTSDEPVPMAALLVTLRREAEALSQGRHTISVEDGAHCDLSGSAKELHSAFSNLVSNAVRYNADRRAHRRDLRAHGQRRRRAVGAGLRPGHPAQHLPRITERFYRVSTSRSRETGGTGLGLSIVKHVLGLHGAQLRIDSEVGRGSTFACVFGPERVLRAQRRRG
jgi:two-component system phosphate regulon sensor histidine kinase PhoR